MNDVGFFPRLLLIAVAVAVYFIPNWVASARGHHNANAIFVTNLLLGWTVLGWIVALVWSLTAVNRKAQDVAPSEQAVPDTRPCPFCAETIKKAAVVCRYCGRDIGPEVSQPSR